MGEYLALHTQRAWVPEALTAKGEASRMQSHTQEPGLELDTEGWLGVTWRILGSLGGSLLGGEVK